MAKRICSIPDCGRPHDAHGWCSQHRRRWEKYGDPMRGGPIRERRTPPADGVCTVEGCESPPVSRGWCSTHAMRWRRHGDPLHFVPPSPTYVAVHLRLTSTKGRAAGYPCVDCGCPARDWSYVGGDPNELADPSTGAIFSLDQERYVPRCRSCHKKFDAV